MNEKLYYSAADIAAMLGISMGTSYKILREMNGELASKGFLTISEKIPIACVHKAFFANLVDVAWYLRRFLINIIHSLVCEYLLRSSCISQMGNA